jgi:serine/threonine protein phosphatase 1
MPPAALQFRPAPGALPKGMRVYAIGDIHGCDDQLAALHGQIVEDLAARPIAQPVLLHIGDYVDRGPASAAVIARLAAGPPAPALLQVNLLGNHEKTMLDALSGERAAITDWRHGGGDIALQSWGIAPDSPPDSWAARIPAAHLAVLRALQLHHRAGDYLFAHAGIRPGIPLAQQAAEDFYRIRHDFLASEADHGMVVVHGHTPVRHGPEVYANRIAIDTGAVFGRALTCVVLEGRRLAFLAA